MKIKINIVVRLYIPFNSPPSFLGSGSGSAVCRFGDGLFCEWISTGNQLIQFSLWQYENWLRKRVSYVTCMYPCVKKRGRKRKRKNLSSFPSGSMKIGCVNVFPMSLVCIRVSKRKHREIRRSRVSFFSLETNYRMIIPTWSGSTFF